MAYIPMNQAVTVYKAGTSLDKWGNPTSPEPISLECRVDEGSFITTDLQGQSVVATARILFDGLADIGYDDDIEFTNELQDTFKRKPKKINPKRGFAGDVLMTEVML